jgi:cytochrome c oxidase subunit III
MNLATADRTERARAAELQPILEPQFDDVEQQHEASALGMWIFLATEVMFFGGLLTSFAVYRSTAPVEFARASGHLHVWIGCINTVVLLSSSLTMALAVRASRLCARKSLLLWLILTMALGALFLGFKALEYTEEYHEKLVPGLNYNAPAVVPDAASRGVLDARKFELFFVFYFFMTGLHAIHLIIGIGLLSVMTVLSWRRWLSGCGVTHIDVSGLYWHFVDVVWVFLYPLLYLIDVHQ